MSKESFLPMFELFKELRLSDILSQTNRTDLSIREAYILRRSFLLQGNLDNALKNLDRASPTDKEDTEERLIKNLIRAQAEILKNNPPSLGTALTDHSLRPSDPFLRGEIFATTGHVLLRSNNPRAAISHFTRASKNYHLVGAQLLAKECEYQKIKCLLRLNEYPAYTSALEELLIKLRGEPDSFFSKSLLLKTQAMANLEAEELQSAGVALKELLELLGSLNLKTEREETLSQYAYSLLVAHNLEELELLYSLEYASSVQGDSPCLLLFAAINELRLCSSIGKSDAVLMLKRLEDYNAPVEHRLCLSHCLLEQFYKQEDYLQLKWLAMLTLNLTKRTHFFNWAPVFSYFYIVSLFQLDRVSQGCNELARFKRVARQRNHLSRLNKVSELESLFLDSTFPKAIEPIMVQILPRDCSIMINETKYSFEKEPNLFSNLIQILREQTGISHADFYKALFDRQYNTEVDQPKLFLVYERLKSILGNSAIIITPDEIRIADHVSCFPQFLKDAPKKRLERRKLISQHLKNSAHPLPISDIQASLHYSRRTLQMDLNQMAANGTIKFIGYRKNRKYYVEKN